MEKILCKWGCGKIATHQLKDGSWVCTKKHRGCPIVDKKIRDSIKKSYEKVVTKKSQMKKLAKKGKRRCKYCNQTAGYWLGGDNFCCSEKGRQCPNFYNWLSHNRKKYYAEHPEFLKKMQKIVKNMGKNEEIQNKKRETMLLLHNGECDKCKNFQKNFNKKRKSVDDLKKELMEVYKIRKSILEGKTKRQLFGILGYEKKKARLKE